MKKITVFFLFFAIFCMFFKMFADDDDEKLKLAVMEFEDLSGKLSKKMISSATEYIRGAFVASNKFIVIAKERQENAMIKQMKKESYKVCNDKNCQIPLGQALSADTILRTTITFFAKKYTITSELIDLAKEATTKGAKATFDGSEKSLKEAISSIVAQIAGKEKQKKESKPKDSQDEYACKYAKQKATISVWNQYLEDFPNGVCAELAHETIDKMACDHAEKNNTIEAWELYLKHQSQGKCAFKAKTEIKELKRAKERWSDRSSNEMNWSSAKQYCEDLTEGGYTDWRLPTISELKTTIQNCQSGGSSCRVSDSCLADSCWSKSCCCEIRSNNGGYYSKLGDDGKVVLWSSSAQSDSPNGAWVVGFNDGGVGGNFTSFDSYVRCVR